MKIKEIHKQEPVTTIATLRLVLLAGMTFGLKLNTMQLTSSMIALEALLTWYTRNKVSPKHHSIERRGVTKEEKVLGLVVNGISGT